jgi:hypothetical protein
LFTGKYNQFYLQDKRGPCDFNLGTLDTGRWGWFIGPIYHPETKELLKDEYGFEAIVTPDFYTHDEKYYFKFYLKQRLQAPSKHVETDTQKRFQREGVLFSIVFRSKDNTFSARGAFSCKKHCKKLRFPTKIPFQ